MRLREHGIALAVDDAGAGYASFTQLLRLRPEFIKIDGELIADIDNDPAKRAIATALTSLGSEMNATMVAEAVETAGQLQALIDLGIEYGQGFHLACPKAWSSHGIGDCDEKDTSGRAAVEDVIGVGRPTGETRSGTSFLDAAANSRRVGITGHGDGRIASQVRSGQVSSHVTGGIRGRPRCLDN